MVPGWLEVSRRDLEDGWRAMVRYRTARGMRYLQWRGEPDVSTVR